MHDSGLPRRTWLHVSDTAAAVIAIIKSGVTNEIYNISGNYEEQNIVVARQIVNIFFNKVEGFEEHLDLTITRPGQDVRYSIDDTKLKALGWQPRAVFEVELVKIVEYYRRNFVW
jgi:dTDP-D-glucose 4,6-dehydratase